jgi:hypothetical protein
MTGRDPFGRVVAGARAGTLTGLAIAAEAPGIGSSALRRTLTIWTGSFGALCP